ncbi:MAG: 4'-phosphopantetheinyl transferase superfamily protein [Vicinamibacterales bacterium]
MRPAVIERPRPENAGNRTPRVAAVHVAIVPLTACPTTVATLWPLLEVEQRRRATAFKQPILAARFIIAHGVLRRALSVWTGTPSEALTFHVGPWGKPSLASGPFFNLSHGGNILLLGISADFEIGVDVEAARLAGHETDILETLPPVDRTRIRLLPQDAQARATLQAWTRMEAALKARGIGLGAERQESDCDLWISDLPIDEQHVASLAVKGGPAEVSCSRFASSEEALESFELHAFRSNADA